MAETKAETIYEQDQQWESVGLYTWRLRVPGGWLYRTTASNSVHMIFVARTGVSSEDSR